MANTFGTQMTKIQNTVPPERAEVGDVGGRVRVFNEKVTLAAQASGDTITVGLLPAGARVLYGIIYSTVTFGATATIAISKAGATGKYRAAAVFTAVDTPTLFGITADAGEKLTAAETVIVTIAAAALPGSGTFRVMLFYTLD